MLPRALVLRAAGLALALSAAVGCQTRPRAEGATTAAPADAGAATAPPVGPRTRSLPSITTMPRPPEPTIELPRELRFTLLEPGRGPRRALRYRPDAAAAPRELVAQARVSTHAYADGTWTDAVTAAPVRDGFGVTAAATGDGGAVVQLRGLVATVDEAGASPVARVAADEYLTRWRSLLERRRADVTVDARGRLARVALLDDPAGARLDARDELVQRWLGLVVPVPEEPVAVGARWRVVTALRTGGAVLKQTATYRLRAVDTAGWTVEVEAERIGEPQDIMIPGVDGVLGELVALRRVVKGTLTVAATDPLPTRGALTSSVASHARFRMPDGTRSERYAEDEATIELGPP